MKIILKIQRFNPQTDETPVFQEYIVEADPTDRLPKLDDPDGVWACNNHFECTKACPRQIKITKRINQTKQRIKAHRELTRIHNPS